MGNTIQGANQIRERRVTTEAIRQEPFFQDCISRLPSKEDAVSIYRCEEKTGELIGAVRVMKQHPRFRELASYVHGTLHLRTPEKIVDQPKAVDFLKSALVMLDSGHSLLDSCQMAWGFQQMVKSSHAESFVAAALQDKPRQESAHPSKRFSWGLQQLSHKQAKMLQQDCVHLWSAKLQREGMPKGQADAQAEKLLGSTKFDGDFGSNSQGLLDLVLGDLKAQGKIDLGKIRLTEDLAAAIMNQSLQLTLSELSI